MKLIDKDAIVAKIEELISNGKIKCQQSQDNNDHISYTAWSEHIATCGKILSFINTLEVKEVDLEKEIDDYLAKEWEGIEEDKHFYDMMKNDLSDIAKHFFELGLKV